MYCTISNPATALSVTVVNTRNVEITANLHYGTANLQSVLLLYYCTLPYATAHSPAVAPILQDRYTTIAQYYSTTLLLYSTSSILPRYAPIRPVLFSSCITNLPSYSSQRPIPHLISFSSFPSKNQQ